MGINWHSHSYSLLIFDTIMVEEGKKVFWELSQASKLLMEVSFALFTTVSLYKFMKTFLMKFCAKFCARFVRVKWRKKERKVQLKIGPSGISRDFKSNKGNETWNEKEIEKISLSIPFPIVAHSDTPK